MKLYLARHGDYALDPIKGMDVLTEKGIEDITRVADWVKAKNIHVSRILHSGKPRAEQTAELLAKGFVSANPPVVYQGLKPNDEVADLANDLALFEEDILVVGHMPFLGRLVSRLITGDDKREIVNFNTGTLVCLVQISKDHWLIEWVMSPAY